MSERPRNILLCSLNNLGDCILFLPVAQALKTAWPDARLTLLTSRVGREAAGLTGLFDDFIAPAHSPKDRKVKHRTALLRLLRRIRRGRYELGVMASGESSYVCAALYLGGVARRIGFNDCKLRFLLTDRVAAREIENEALRNMRLTGPLNLPADIAKPPCHVSDLARRDAWKTLSDLGLLEKTALPRVLIHPGSAVLNRRWPEARFARFCLRLHREGTATPVLLEGPAEAGIGQRIRELAGIEMPVVARLDSVESLAAVMGEMDLFLGHSTGTLHVAMLVGLPSVSLWGVSDSRVWGPAWDADRHVLVKSPVQADPQDDILRRSEILPCMKAIELDAVMQAVTGQLRRRHEP